MFHSDYNRHSIFRFGGRSFFFVPIVSMSHSHSLYDCMCEADIGDRIAAANVLVVGAGGIGCEVLKNLVLSGFKRTTTCQY